MKSLFVSIILGSFCLLATAQTKENGFFMELNGGYGTVEYSTSKSTTHDGYLFLAPRLGYQFNHQCTLV